MNNVQVPQKKREEEEKKKEFFFFFFSFFLSFLFLLFVLFYFFLRLGKARSEVYKEGWCLEEWYPLWLPFGNLKSTVARMQHRVAPVSGDCDTNLQRIVSFLPLVLLPSPLEGEGG